MEYERANCYYHICNKDATIHNIQEEYKMKKWNNPAIEEIDLNATEYAPTGGYLKDGTFLGNDKRTVDFYGPSSGNSGDPVIE